MELVRHPDLSERPVSDFNAGQLMYFYVLGQLDPSRSQSIEKLIQDNPSLKFEKEKIENGLEYCQVLASVPVPELKIEALQQKVGSLEYILQKSRVDQWPKGLRLGFESLGLVALVFIFGLMIPWPSLYSFLKERPMNVTLSEAQKIIPRVETEINSEFIATNREVPKSIEEQKIEEPAQVVAKLEDSANVPDEAASQSLEPAVQKKPERIPAASGGGFIHRGRLKLTNVQASTLKLVEAFTNLGARKAGEVPMGWTKGKGSYFHFTIPEAKYDEMIAAMKIYGELAIAKEPHPRIMHEGIIRVIIDVEERFLKNEHKTEPPIESEPPSESESAPGA